MIDPAKLPTDNLYKFMALSGLVVVVLSVVLPDLERRAVREQTWEFQREGMAILVELEDAMIQRGVRIPEPQPLAKDEGADGSVETFRKIGRFLADLDKAVRNDLGKDAKPYRMKIVAIRALRTKVESLFNGAWWYTVIGSAVMVNGILLSVVGFWLWYYRLQKFQDQIVIAESKKSEPSQESPPAAQVGVDGASHDEVPPAKPSGDHPGVRTGSI